jgi:thiamine pyrophosphokinase
MRSFVVASSPHSLKPERYCPQPGDRVIAADGGANLCEAWEWRVDAVVGDMDSIDPRVSAKLQAGGVAFHCYPAEKDETDLEIALHLALDQGADEILIAGALGARIDHTLGNLALLALPALAGVRTFIVDGGQSIWLVRDRLTIDGQPGDTLSLLPFGGDACGVTITGVHWPLLEADLLLGPSLGISNRLTATKAAVSVRSGAILAIHIHAGAIL